MMRAAASRGTMVPVYRLRPTEEASMPQRHDSPGLPERAVRGDMTPMRPEEATVDPTAEALGETPDHVAQPPNDRTVADGELPIEERRAHGIEDNVRHVGSLGRR
jgi:hypothetical protein